MDPAGGLEKSGTQGEHMGVTAFPPKPSYPQGQAEDSPPEQSNRDWVGIASGSALLAGALLLLSGRKRAGLVVAAGATAVTMLDQKETILDWWHALPQHLDNVQRFLDQTQHRVENLSAAREKLHGIFKK
jgi:hypothetical protein